MSKIAPCLWFDSQADDAATFYVETFRACGQEASLTGRAYYGEGMPGRAGSVLTVAFNLAGLDYLALNGGPQFTFSPAISMMVMCEDQAEIDRFWQALSAGGETGQCGWLTDRFGMSWQVVPKQIQAMLLDPDRARADRMMAAVMTMTKLDLAALQAAHRGA